MSGFVGDKSTNLKAGGGTTTDNAGTTTNAGATTDADTIKVSTDENDEERFLKSVGYLTIVDDYIKQIVRESAIMKSFGYDKDKDKDDDAKLTNIIMSNFYSSKYSFHLRLNASSNPKIDHNGCYDESLLDGYGKRINGNANISAITATHENDKTNIGGRNFSEWV